MDIANTLYLAVATVFAVVFFRLAKLISRRSRPTQRYLPLLNAAELILWSVIVFGSVDLFLSHKTYYPYLLLLLTMVFMLIMVWYYLKDIVAGFLFRVRHNPLLTQVLETKVYQGTIKKIGLSQLTLEVSNGRLIRVPYSEIVTQSLSLQSHRASAPGETSVRVTLQSSVDPAYFSRIARESLALSSWCVAAKPIDVQPEPDGEGAFRVSFFLIDPGYLPQAREKLVALAEQARAHAQD